jgi:glycosyltransferase involved in cell wall biosynthesis
LIVAAIPAYNEGKTIAKVVVRAMRHVERGVVVDDGSTDDTAMIVERLGAHVLKHEGNLGYGAAVRSCFSMARDLNSDILVILDAGGQHSADDIPKINEATNRIAKQKISDTQSAFRAYSRKATQRIRLYEGSMGVTSEIDIKSGETSSQNPFSHSLEILSAILRTAGEKHPVALFGFPGFVSIVAGLGGWLCVANRFAEVRELPIGIALVSTVLLIAGIWAVMTGVILYTIANVSRRLS